MADNRNYFTFDGISSKDFDVYISGNKTYGAAEADVSSQTVPGRNGALLLYNNRFNNVEYSYDAFILNDMDSNIAGLRDYLLSKKTYCRLEDTYHPDEYRMAVFRGPFEPDVHQTLLGGSFTLNFECKPQRFLDTGTTPVTFSTSQTFVNPTNMDARPLIQVWGTGSFRVGSTTITIKTHGKTYMYIDCELQDAYYESTNLNYYVSLSPNVFPVLPGGASTVIQRVSTSITQIRVWPRWWRL